MIIIAMVSFHTIGMCNLGELELQERYTKVQPKLGWKNLNKTFENIWDFVDILQF